MFSSSKNKNMARNVAQTGGLESANRIVEGTSVTGDVKCESNIRIDGTLNGNLITKGKLVIGPTGRIEGTVECENAEIEGSMNGKIKVNSLFSVKSTGKINGEAFFAKVKVEEGAELSCTCNLGNESSKNISNNQNNNKKREAVA